MKKFTIFFLVAVLVLGLSGMAGAAVVTLTTPDESQATTFTATVAEQAAVTVPAGVAFSVGNVATSTASSAQTVTVTQIVLTNGKAIKIWLKANAATFTKPGGSVTWADSDVTWNAATWSASGTGNADTLDEEYALVATSPANPASLSSTNLVFTLAAKATVDRAGDHTLAATWKFESFTPGP